MRKLILTGLLPLCLFGLAACASPADRALRNSPEFKAGYSDGCASASLQGANPRQSGLMRDDAAYRANRAYRSGWGSGFGACREVAAPGAAGPLGMPRTP